MSTESTNLLADLDQWYESYSTASPKERYEMLQALIETPLSSEAIEEIDLGMLLLEMREELVGNGLVDEAIAFIEKLQRQQPELYKEEYPYHDKFRALYYLYSNQPDRAKEVLAHFKAYPETGIDEMLLVLEELRFYNAAEIAADLCRSTYGAIADSSEILPGTENKLSEIILIDGTEQAYRKIQQGETVDWEEFWTELANYGYRDNTELAERLPVNLATTVEANAQFFKDFKQKQSRERAIEHLCLDFCKVMFENKQMRFACAGGIWDVVLDFLLERDLPPKKLNSPDSLFSFTQQELDRHIAQRIGSFFSLRHSAAIAVLWGIPYVYDFLRDREMIRPDIYRRAIAAAEQVKLLVVNNLSQLGLWKFDFVHRWLPANSVSPEDFAAQAQKFADSLASPTPLSEEPRPKQDPLLGLMQNEFENKIDGQIEELEDEDRDKDEDKDKVLFPPPKASKPRKSAMKLAAELYAQDDKKSKPKSQKKK
ncbi:MAG: hypothetical protein SW833_27260 [Cyanobacteriota bacterium]|nr:hypothetical protein [Cyanobacteriota bacterium]